MAAIRGCQGLLLPALGPGVRAQDGCHPPFCSKAPLQVGSLWLLSTSPRASSLLIKSLSPSLATLKPSPGPGTHTHTLVSVCLVPTPRSSLWGNQRGGPHPQEGPPLI